MCKATLGLVNKDGLQETKAIKQFASDMNKLNQGWKSAVTSFSCFTSNSSFVVAA
jgi:hypothetical protein